MKQFLIFLNILLATAAARAQSATETFAITLPSTKVAGSLYKTVRLVDVRPDKEQLGIVQLGAFNRKAKVITETPLDEQLSGVMTALTDSTAGDGELFLLLRQLSFAEVTGAMSERGYCHFRAVLFAKTGDSFQKLDRVDTVITVKSMDVTKGLLRQGSRIITELLSTNLAKAPEGPAYSSGDVVHFESLEKKNIVLYTATAYRDGIYKTYRSFADQRPDEETLTVEFAKDGKAVAVKRVNDKGKKERIYAKDMYAFVYTGQPYVATDLGYYPLVKKEDDFFFTGKAKTTAGSGDVAMASLFFGVIGGLIASAPGNAVFDMKIDYAGGGFIRLKERKGEAESE